MAVGDADAVAVAGEALGGGLSKEPAAAVAGSGTIATAVDGEEGVDVAAGEPQAANELATSRMVAAVVRRPTRERFCFTAGSPQPWAGFSPAQAIRKAAAIVGRIALQAGGVPRVAQCSSASWAFRCSPITFSAICDGTSW
jgi:hypothetical protein